MCVRGVGGRADGWPDVGTETRSLKVEERSRSSGTGSSRFPFEIGNMLNRITMHYYFNYFPGCFFTPLLLSHIYQDINGLHVQLWKLTQIACFRYNFPHIVNRHKFNYSSSSHARVAHLNAQFNIMFVCNL